MYGYDDGSASQAYWENVLRPLGQQMRDIERKEVDRCIESLERLERGLESQGNRIDRLH